jgi:hypothetical protein
VLRPVFVWVFFVNVRFKTVFLFLMAFLRIFMSEAGVALALVNFKYELGLIGVLRLVSCLKLLKKRKRRLQRRSKAFLLVF